MFTFFASSALGMNHPAWPTTRSSAPSWPQAAVNKPSNSDVYSVPMARFVDTFARVLGDPALPHLFFVDGGALAVENALKVAFDWKSRHNEARGDRSGAGHQGAAPARRVPRPQRLHDVADQHRPEQGGAVPEVRLAAHRRAVHAARREHGCAGSRVAAPGPCGVRGAPARHRLLHRRADPGRGRRPALPAAVLRRDARTVRRVRRAADLRRGADRLRDHRNRLGLPAIGRRARCRRVRQEDAGVRRHGRRRVDEVADNVFAVSSRINSTWGGNLVDMVRSRRILEVIESDELFVARPPRPAAICWTASTSSPPSSRDWCSTCAAAG